MAAMFFVRSFSEIHYRYFSDAVIHWEAFRFLNFIHFEVFLLLRLESYDDFQDLSLPYLQSVVVLIGKIFF